MNEDIKNKSKPSDLSEQVAELLMDDFARRHNMPSARNDAERDDYKHNSPSQVDTSPYDDLQDFSEIAEHSENPESFVEEMEDVIAEEPPMPHEQLASNVASVSARSYQAETDAYDDRDDESLPYEFKVDAPAKRDNSLKVSSLISEDEYSDEPEEIKSRPIRGSSFEPHAFDAEPEDEFIPQEDYEPHNRIEPAAEESYGNELPDSIGAMPMVSFEGNDEILDELAAKHKQYNVYEEDSELVSHERNAIRQTSDVGYMDSALEPSNFSSGLQDKVAIPHISSEQGNVLDQICAAKHKHIERQKAMIMESKLRESIYSMPTPRGFLSHINSKIAVGQNALIAEVKKASPSKGIIRADFEPGLIAKAYEAGGATCISVLTDTPYFQGRDEYINMVKRAVELPVLRKDFILDPYQVVESRALGADCILLIMAALTQELAIVLEDEAIALGMDVLVEVHDEEDLEKALKLKSMLIGINNRDLKTLEIDLVTTERLTPMVPFPRTVVCESGIYGYEDVVRMNNARVKAFLVGESLMSQDNIKLATERLLGNSI